MSTPKGSSTPRPTSRQADHPTEPDPSKLLSELSLAPSSAQAIPTPSSSGQETNSGVSLPSSSSLIHRAHLDALQQSRIHSLELADQSLWIPLLPSVLPFAFFARAGGAGLGRGLDPQVLEGMVLELGGDRGPIRRRSRREIEGREGRWEVVLEGFHHLTDEEDALDPLTSSSLATLKSSSRWESLFDPSSPYAPEIPVIVEQAAYGVPSSLLPPAVRDELTKLAEAGAGGKDKGKVAPDVGNGSGSNTPKPPSLSKEALQALEICAKRGAVGFGIRWSHPGKVGEGESLWGWIWGEEPAAEDDDDEDYDDDYEGGEGGGARAGGGAGEEETTINYKAVHLVKAEEEQDGSSKGDVQGGEGAGDDGEEGFVNDGADVGDL